MKPRNKFEQAVLVQSKHLRPITKAQTQWAFRECIEHYAYRLPKGNTTCMDCGHSWQMDEPTEHCTCPHCGAGLQVATTRARKLQQKHYFTVLTTSGGYQVLRNLLILSESIEGRRIETVEVSLEMLKVIQSRGLYNKNTEYHEQIVEFVNANSK